MPNFVKLSTRLDSVSELTGPYPCWTCWSNDLELAEVMGMKSLPRIYLSLSEQCHIQFWSGYTFMADTFDLPFMLSSGSISVAPRPGVGERLLRFYGTIRLTFLPLQEANMPQPKSCVRLQKSTKNTLEKVDDYARSYSNIFDWSVQSMQPVAKQHLPCIAIRREVSAAPYNFRALSLLWKKGAGVHLCSDLVYEDPSEESCSTTLTPYVFKDLRSGHHAHHYAYKQEPYKLISRPVTMETKIVRPELWKHTR